MPSSHGAASDCGLSDAGSLGAPPSDAGSIGDGSSDDGDVGLVSGGLRRSSRLKKRRDLVPDDKITEVTEAMNKEYSWGLHEGKCMARLFKCTKANGYQCSKNPLACSDFVRCTLCDRQVLGVLTS